MKPTFFRTPSEFRRWLATHHARASELLVGYYKKGSGRPSITWPESVDEALCFGWIDSIRRSVDEISYAIRFTPRRPGSNWSSVNVNRVRTLIEQGKMQPAGLKAYETRKKNEPGISAHEKGSGELAEPYSRLLRKDKTAWRFFGSQPAFYRKAIARWIVSAKKEETRLKRLEKLIAFSARQQRLPEMRPR